MFVQGQYFHYKKFPKAKLTLLLLVVAGLTCFTVKKSSADVFAKPSTTVEKITPREARTYAELRTNNLSSSNIIGLNEVSLAVSPSFTMRYAATSGVSINQVIDKLARALHYDPLLIYDYVHNHIDYVPYFGILKGARQTLIDGSGNDFDQASLLVELLRASGYTANFVSGDMTIPGDEMASWLGFTDFLNMASYLSTNAVPYYSVRLPDGQTEIFRVWVRANINGTDYDFDPALKAYVEINKIDIGQAMQYNRNDLISAATTGATIGTDYTENLNEALLQNKLVEYSSNLVDKIHTQYPNAEIGEILGGRSIFETNLDQLQVTLPHVTTDEQVWTEIPAGWHTLLQVEHDAGINAIFSTDFIAGRRFTLTYNANNEAQLSVEVIGGSLGESFIITGTMQTPFGDTNNLTVTVDHPYLADSGSYLDRTDTYSIRSGDVHAIITSFGGGTSSAQIKRHQERLALGLDVGVSELSEYVFGHSLTIMGLRWMRQRELALKLNDSLTDTLSVTHHKIGLVIQRVAPGLGYYIDLPGGSRTVMCKTGISSDVDATFNAQTIGSAFEHAVLEQSMGSNIPAISTIRALQIANSLGHKIFFANSSNWSSISPQLLNYSQADLDNFTSLINQGSDIILSEDGNVILGSWQGHGYAARNYPIGGGITGIAMIISGGIFGGYSTESELVSGSQVSENYRVISYEVSENAAVETPKSEEPVDMATGSYLYENTDLSLGGNAPLGLALNRSYSSSLKFVKSDLGHGWTHSYNIHLTPASNEDPGLGTRLPVDAAALIAELYVALDLMKNEDTNQGWMIMFLGHKWAIDRLIDNSMIANVGNNVLEYIKLADGNYSPPPGIATALIDNGDGTFSLQERFGATLNFDTSHRITQLLDVDGNTMLFGYTGDKLTTVTDAFSRTLTLQYTNDLITSVLDSAGRSVVYSYDANDDLTGYSDAENKLWQFGYDSLHRLTTLTNPLSTITATNTYDTQSRVETQTVPRQSAANATYNFYFSGYRNVEEDPYGKKTIYYFDNRGRQIVSENELGDKITTEFDGQNHQTQITDPRGNVTSFFYDGDNNLTEIENALTHTTLYRYDSQFRLVELEDALMHITAFDYDAEHHLTKTTSAELSEISQTYYPIGQVQTITDGRDTVTTLMYDAFGLTDTSQTSTHPVIDYVYDSIGRLQVLMDQVGSTSNFQYDNRSLIEVEEDPLTNQVSFIYDDAGRVTSRVDRNDDIVGFSYIPSGELETITYPDMTSVNFTYNLHNQITQMQDLVGTTDYDYDNIYRVTSVTTPHNHIVSYEYDAAGNVSKIIYPGNKEVIYTYDALNRVETVTNWLSQTATYNYDDAGRLISVTNFNGSTTTFGYDNDDRLTSLENRKSDTSVIATYGFTLDANGNRIDVIRDEPQMSFPNSSSTTFTYNPEKNRLLNAGGVSHTYDDEGQLTTKGSDTFVFDLEHRLVSVNGSQSLQYKYDGMGKRLETIHNGLTTRYIYDLAGNLLAEADGNNTITRYYIHGIGLLAMVSPTDEVYTYHFDGTGNTVAMTNESQTIVNSYTYLPFGEVIAETETISQPFKFVGKYGIMQESNGFYYMRARYYDPSIGRFISEDPIGFDGGQVNLYAYVGGNPVNFVDPSGEFACGGVCVTALGIVGGLAFDYALDVIRGSGNGGLVTAGNAGVGAGFALTIKTQLKPRKGAAGGGPAGDLTSYASKLNHAAYAAGLYKAGARNLITKGLRAVPYISAAYAAYQLGDALYDRYNNSNQSSSTNYSSGK